MHAIRYPLIVLTLAALAAGCNRPAEPTAPATATIPDATAAVAEPAEPADATEADTDQGGQGPLAHTGAPGTLDNTTLVRMAAAMSAAVEQCGLATRAQSAEGLSKIKAELATKGANPAQVEREFWSIYDASIAAGRVAPPAQMKVQCEQLRAMGDPEQIRKMQQAIDAYERKQGAGAR